MPKRVTYDPTKDRPKTMNAQDRAQTQSEIAQAEAQLAASAKPGNEKDPYYAPPVSDPGEVRKQIEHKKMLLARDEETWARGSEKDRLMARKKEIEGILTTHKPTQKEMSQMPTGNNSSAFSRAVQHNVTYQEKYQPLEHELQEINVKLEPHDPNAHNLEYLRNDVSDGAISV